MKLDGDSALITGASAGLGCEFARQLAGRMRSFILLARREQQLNELRDELTQQHPNLVVHVRRTDLAEPRQLKDLMAWLDHEKIDVHLLINNAGLGDIGSFATSDSRRNEQIMLVNMVALTSLTRHLLPQMIARKRGGILNVSSSAGFLPIPGFAVYAASPLPWSGTHRISGGRKALGGTSGKRPGICCCHGRTGRAGCASSAGVQSATHHSRFEDEAQHASGSHDANANLALGVAVFREAHVTLRRPAIFSFNALFSWIISSP